MKLQPSAGEVRPPGPATESSPRRMSNPPITFGRMLEPSTCSFPPTSASSPRPRTNNRPDEFTVTSRPTAGGGWRRRQERLSRTADVQYRDGPRHGLRQVHLAAADLDVADEVDMTLRLSCPYQGRVLHRSSPARSPADAHWWRYWTASIGDSWRPQIDVSSAEIVPWPRAFLFSCGGDGDLVVEADIAEKIGDKRMSST